MITIIIIAITCIVSILCFNMLTLYFFGRVVEQYFDAVFGNVIGYLALRILPISARFAIFVENYTCYLPIE